VLVADDTVKLIGWQTAVIDRGPRRLSRRLTPADDVFALGEILMALGGGRPTTSERRGLISTIGWYPSTAGTYTEKAVDWAGSRWDGAVWEPLRTLVSSSLFNPRRDRPTAAEIADVFSGLVMRTAPGSGTDDGTRERERELLLAPLPSGDRVVVLGLQGDTEATGMTLQLGKVFAEARPDRVIVLGIRPGAGRAGRPSQREAGTELRDLADQLGRLLPDLYVVTELRRTSDGGFRVSRERPSPDGRPINEAGHPAQPVIEALSATHPLALIHVTPDTERTVPPGVLDLADQLVIVWSAKDGRRPTDVDATFDWITAQGHAELLRRSIVVITGEDNFNPLEYSKLVPQRECRAMVAIPYDPDLASGQMVVSALPPKTLAAYRQLAVLLAEGFTSPGGGRAG
jgi:hypothetical protein